MSDFTNAPKRNFLKELWSTPEVRRFVYASLLALLSVATNSIQAEIKKLPNESDQQQTE